MPRVQRAAMFIQGRAWMPDCCIVENFQRKFSMIQKLQEVIFVSRVWGRKTRFIEKNGFSFPKKKGVLGVLP
jgi:hypothetical protein